MKKLIPMLLVCCLLVVPAAAAADIERSETVYVTLDNSGQPTDIRVVTWLRGDIDQPSWVDYGDYDQVINSVSDLQPSLGAGTITWPASALQGEGLFYEGRTSRQLPVELAISYHLDGEKQMPHELVGKSGELQIEVQVRNSLRHDRVLAYQDIHGRVQHSTQVLYTPMAVQLSLSLPVGDWTDVAAPGANTVLVGNQLRLSWALFPYPDATLTVKARGSEISLAPMEISVLPMMPPLPDLSTAAELTELVGGLDQIDGSLRQLSTAVGALAEGQAQLSSGISGLTGGLSQIEQGLQASQAGASSLVNGLDQLQSVNQGLVESANLLLQSGDQRLIALAQGILAEQQIIEQLVAGGQPLSIGLAESTAGLANLTEQAQGLLPASGQLATGQQVLSDGLIGICAQGIGPLRSAAVEQYSSAQVGLSIGAEMQRLVNNQHSFIDNARNQVGKVQYLMRTEGIELPKQEQVIAEAAPKLSLWQRIVRFFSGKQGA